MFWCPKLIPSGKWWIWQNSLNFKSQIGEIPILNWGRSEFLKLLLIFHNHLENSQHESCSTFWVLQLSCWSLFKIPNRFWIGDSNWKGGHFLEIYIFKITFNFVLKLQKLKTRKLYTLTSSTTLLLNSSPNFASFLSYTKGGKSRVLKSGFFPPIFSETFHPRDYTTNTSITSQHKHTLIP